MWDKLWEAIQKYGGSARDARIGAAGADQVRDLYKSDKQEDKELAKELNDKYLAANAAGIGGGATAASALTTGVIPTLVSEVGGTVGSYVGNKAGSYLDEKLDTKWIAPTLSIIGGLGSGIGSYKGLVNAGTKGLLKGNSVMYGKNFVSDVVATSLNKATKVPYKPTYGLVKWYGPTMGKTTAAKTNPNLVDFDDYIRTDLETLASKYGMNKQQLMMSQDPAIREEARQVMLKSIAGWKQNPNNASKTLVISKSDIIQDPIYNNTPMVLKKEEFLRRNAARGETDINNSIDWYNGTRKKGGNTLLEWPDEQGVYISDIEPYIPDPHQITFTPQQPSWGTTSYKFYEQPSTYFKDAKYAASSKSYGGKEVPAWQLPKGERNNVLNGHLKGDDAVLMFKQYGGDKFPENSAIKTQIEKLIPEARERYGLVGNTNITDDEIAGSLYKRAMELNGEGNAVVWETGEPRLLFRGDTRRYNKLRDRLSPEEVAKREDTMDNSLGTLFLGDISGKGRGIDRYFISGIDRREPTMKGSSTGARGKFGSILARGEEGTLGTKIPYIPKDAYKLATYHTSLGPYSLYKFPGKYSASGISDLNTFIVRTPAMRDATGEISVLADDVVMKTKNYRGPNIDDYDGPTYDGVNSTVRDAMAKHYQSVLDDAQSKGQGLLFSEGLTDEYIKKFGEIHPFRREHEKYDYYALPNFNKQNAKHLFGWDLRNPADWTSDIIYKQQGGKLKLQSGNKITPEHARLLGRRGMPGDKEALAAAGYDSKGRPLVTFGGGSFGGAGAGVSFKDGIEQVENYDYVRNTPILQSFSDAFNNARKSGLSSFTFNGKEYTTEMSDNPNYIGKKYQPLLNIREVLDKNMKVMSDSTKIEPYVGQIPGTHRRESSQ